jgi:hypothetical protein
MITERKIKDISCNLFQKLDNIESPYEFVRLWQSLKDDVNLELHAKLLRCIAHEDINKSKFYKIVLIINVDA